MTHLPHRSDSSGSDRLAALFGNDDWATLHRAWSQHPVHIRAGSRRFDQLFDWVDLQRLLEQRRHIGQTSDIRRVRRSPTRFAQATTCEVTREGQPASAASWAMPDDNHRLDPVAFNHLLRGGSSLVLRRLDEFSLRIGELCDALETEWLAPTNAVAVASWNETPGLGLHLDAEEVLVLQISGHKRWKVWEPTRSFPFGRMNDEIATEPDGPPSIDIIVAPGDILHLPCGWWHLVEPLGEPSLHVTFNVFRTTPLDIFDALLDELAEEPLLGTVITVDRQVIDGQVQALRELVRKADPSARAIASAYQIASRVEAPTLPRLANQK